MTTTTQRSLKWCPEMGIVVFQTATGKQRLYSLAEIAEMVMSDESRAVMNQLVEFAKSNPNQWIDY